MEGRLEGTAARESRPPPPPEALLVPAPATPAEEDTREGPRDMREFALDRVIGPRVVLRLMLEIGRRLIFFSTQATTFVNQAPTVVSVFELEVYESRTIECETFVAKENK
jgi:hypothetical protein